METSIHLKTKKDIILKVDNLSVKFKVQTKQGWFNRAQILHAVNNVSFNLFANETLGIVGESGSGKSTLVRAILRLLNKDDISGKVIWQHQNVMKFDKKALTSMRKNVEIVFQDPLASLNPRMNILEIISEPLLIHYPSLSGEEVIHKVTKVMHMVGLNPNVMHRYPHEFSGGQSQRIGIARAIILNPKLIICDEAVSALDVSIKAQIINLLQRLKKEINIAYLFISHDLGVVQYLSDRVLVLYLGDIVELASVEDIYSNPMHPYTRALIAAVPVPNPTIEAKKIKAEIKGDIPSPFEIHTGCPFASRCNLVFDRCYKEKPKLLKVKDSLVACFKAK